MTKGQIRKELKKNARFQLDKDRGVLIGANLIVGVLMTLPTFIEDMLGGIMNISYTAMILITLSTTIIGLPLYIGLNSMCLDSIKGEKIKIKDLLKGYKRIYQAYGCNLLQTITMDILVLPLVMIPLFMLGSTMESMLIASVITTIGYGIFILLYSQVEFIIADKDDIGPIQAIKKSVYMMKGHLIEYVLLMLSFIGWIMLIGITFGIAYIWVAPYMQLTYANFYEYVKGDKLNKYKKMKNNNNNNIFIGILIGILLCGYIVVQGRFVTNLLAPPAVSNVIRENELNLISVNEAPGYYLSEEENEIYDIEYDDYNALYLTKYTCLVKNHELDIKNDDEIDTTIMYIIADQENVLGVSCEPYYSTDENLYYYNPLPGEYDIDGNLNK